LGGAGVAGLRYLVCVYLFMAGMALADDMTPVEMGAGEWRPFVSETLPDFGLLPTIVNRAFEHQGIRVNYNFHPWMRTETLVADGYLLGAVGYVKNQQRLEKFIYSELPLYSIQQAFFHLADRPVEWQSLKDLQGYTIGITQVYWYGDALNDAIANGELDTLLINDELQGMKMLATGRIDLMVFEQSVGESLIEQLDEELQGRVKANSKLLDSMDVYAIFSRQHAAADFYKNAFDLGLSALQKSGEYQALIDEYLMSVQIAESDQKNSPVSN
jgi:polar amino acid transport system substrate-binding protein